MLGARKPFAVLYGRSRTGTSMRVDDVSGFDCAPAIVGVIARRKRAIRNFETIGSLVAISGRPARLLRDRSPGSVLTRIQCRAGEREESKRRATESSATDSTGCTEKSRPRTTRSTRRSGGHGQHGVHEEVRATDNTEYTEKSRPRTTRSTRTQRFWIRVVRAFRGGIRAPGSVPRNSEPRRTPSARRRGHGQHGVHGLKRVLVIRVVRVFRGSIFRAFR